MTKLFLIAASLLSFAATPVVAREARPAASSTDTPTSSATPSARENQRICLVDSVTGSRIPIKECKTRAQWRAEGIDPFAKD